MLHTLSIGELGRTLSSGQISSVELTRHYLARIERLNPALNALITVTADQALAAAAAADGRRAAGEEGPLLGIPLIHKDIFCTDGVRTSCGSRMLDNFVAPYDATVVSAAQGGRRRHAGQGQYGRVRHGLLQRDQLLRPGQEPLGCHQGPRRLFRRVGGGDGRAPGTFRHRHGYRRFDPPAGRADRRDRRQTDLRTRVALMA